MEFSCWFCLASLCLPLCALQVCITVFLRSCHLLLWIYSLFQQIEKVNRESRNYISSTEKLTQHKCALEKQFPLRCPVWGGIILGIPCFNRMSSFWKTPYDNRACQLISDFLESLHIPWSFSRVKCRKFLAEVFLLHGSMEKPLRFPCINLLHYYLVFWLLGNIKDASIHTKYSESTFWK